MVGDSHAIGVAGKVTDDMLGSAERRLGIFLGLGGSALRVADYCLMKPDAPSAWLHTQSVVVDASHQM